MEIKKIPILNEKIDPYILGFIIRKSLILIILVFFISYGIAFLYLRYTPLVYKASAVLQINNENEKTQILELSTYKDEVNLNQTIELLRSPEFLKRIYNRLPLDVSYYSKGTFLEYELYKGSPFTVEYEISNDFFYERRIFVSFKNSHAILKYAISDDEYIERNITLDKWNDLNGLKIKLTITDYQSIKNQTERFASDAFYFIIHKPANILKFYNPKIEVFILNQEANTIQVNFTDNNPIKTSDIVKTIAEEFINYDIERKIESSKKILSFIEEQSKIIYKTIDSLEEQLLLYKNIPDFNNNSQSNASMFIQNNIIDNIQQEIEKIDIELNAYTKINNYIDKNNNFNLYDIVAQMPSSDPFILSIINKIQNLEEKKQELMLSKTNNNFQIKQIDNQIDTQKNILLKFIEANITRLQEKRKILNEKLNKYTSPNNNTGFLSNLDYLKLKRLYDVNVGYYNKLLEKKAEYLISQAGSVSQNIILQNAITPSEPIAPVKKNVITISTILALLFSFLIIIIRYLLYNEITTVEELQNFTNAKVLGIIPLYKQKLPASQLIIDIKPNSIITEAFRSCRSSIEFIQNNKNQKVIVISSTISGEGKTFIAINLAGIFAMNNKRVILLDLDLRRPRIHIGFNTDNSKGISTILYNKNKLEECIKKTKLPYLDIITAGPVFPHPNELISSERFTELLNNLEQMYDYIIIDTPPIGLVSDALTIFKYNCIPVYVLKSHFSKRSFLYNIQHLMEDKSLSNLLLILNGYDFNKSKYSSRYAYSYNYGYSYVSSESNHYYDDMPIRKKSLIKRLFNLIGL